MSEEVKRLKLKLWLSVIGLCSSLVVVVCLAVAVSKIEVRTEDPRVKQLQDACEAYSLRALDVEAELYGKIADKEEVILQLREELLKMKEQRFKERKVK